MSQSFWGNAAKQKQKKEAGIMRASIIEPHLRIGFVKRY